MPKQREKPTGFIVVMIQFGSGAVGSFKIGDYYEEEPTADQMSKMVFRGGSMALRFLCWQLGDDIEQHEPCWIAVPSTAYMTCSWEYYSFNELADIIEKNQKYEKSGENSLVERMPGTGRGYH